MNIQEFIRGEVSRQGFKTEPSHTEHVKYMLRAWGYAEGLRASGREMPTLNDIQEIAYRIQPHTNNGGWRSMRVRVGNYIAPPPQEIEKLMLEWHEKTVSNLWEKPSWLEPTKGSTWEVDEAYRQFEFIHPFEDGNGRTGKIIHNWLLDRLSDPILVQDFFGGGVP